MQFEGEVFDTYDQSGKVLRASVTDRIIELTYLQDGMEWSISAVRKGESIYQGHLYTKVHSPECSIELGVYKSKSNALLIFCKWISRETANFGSIIFRLIPSKSFKAVPSDKTKNKRKVKYGKK